MKPINRLILLILIAVCWLASGALAAAQGGVKNPLQDVNVGSYDDEVVIRLTFAGPLLGELRPVFAGGAVHIDIPDAEARLDRLYYPTGDDLVRRVLVTRLNERTLRVELPLEAGFGESRPVVLETEGRTLVVKVKKQPAAADPLADLLEKARDEVTPVASASEPQPAAAKPADKPADKLQPREEVKKTSVRFSDPEETGADSLGILPSSLKMLSMLALVLGLMFLLFHGFKKFVLKGTAFGRHDRWVRVLGTSFLGPKKSIALVEVAGEVLVLGIASDNISLLSRIDDEDKIERLTSGAPPARREAAANGNGHAPGEEVNGHATGTQANGHKAKDGFDGLLRQAAKSPKDKYVQDVTEQIRRKMANIKSQ